MAVVIATISLLGACASSAKDTTYGTVLQAQGGNAVELGKTWDAGDALESKGNKDIAKGQKLVREGEEKIAKGEGLVRTGNADAIAQKANYGHFIGTMGLATTPKQMKKEIKSLRDIAETWGNGLDSIKRGEKLIEEGEKNLVEGRAKIRKGGGFVTQGQGQKKAVEIKAQPVEPLTNVVVDDVKLEEIN